VCWGAGGGGHVCAAASWRRMRLGKWGGGIRTMFQSCGAQVVVGGWVGGGVHYNA
jgi:hypothetical protein